MDVKLFIEEQLCDLPTGRDFNIKLNRQFLDLQKIDARSGDFSYSLRLPKTVTNNSIFKSANLATTIGKFVRTEDYVTRLEVKGNNTFNGIFKLTKIDLDYYEGVLVSNTISWVKQLEGKNIDELTNSDGSPWSFPFMGTSATTTQYSLQWYQDNATYDNLDVDFPLIPRGYFFHSGATLNVNGIYGDSINTSDYTPAPYRNKIITKIFDSIGWSVDSDIFGDTEQRKVVIPYNKESIYKYNFKKLYKAESSEGPYTSIFTITPIITNTFHKSCELGSEANSLIKYCIPTGVTFNQMDRLTLFSFDQPTGAGTGNPPPGSNYDYNVNIDSGTLCWDYEVEFTDLGTHYRYEGGTLNHGNPQWSKGGFAFYIYIDDVQERAIFENITLYQGHQTNDINNPFLIFYYDVYQSAVQGTPVSWQPYDQEADISVPVNTTSFVPAFLNTAQISAGTIEFKFRNISVAEGEKIRIAWIGYMPYHFNPSFGIQSYFDVVSTSCRFFAWSGTNTNDEVVISENLPDISCVDFLTDFIRTTNSFISFNQESKTIRLDSFDNFFLDNSFAYDITDKCDLQNNEPKIEGVPINRNLYFKYKTDSNDVLLQQDIEYGNLHVWSDNIYTTGDQTVQSIFSPTRNRNWELSGDPTVQITLPTIFTEGDSTIVPSAITWSYASTPRILKMDGYFSHTGQTQYVNLIGWPAKIPLSRFEDDREGKLSLRWDEDTNGLYDRYYARYLNEIGESHITEYTTRINVFDYSNLLPNVPVRVGHQHYILEKINGFSPIFETTTPVRLIKKTTS